MTKNIYLYIYLLLCISYTPIVYAENITNNTTNNNNYNIEIIIPQTYKETTPGTDVWFTIKILNLGNTKRIDIILINELLDEKNNPVISKKKTVAMETQSSFVTDIQIPSNLKPGKYSIIAKIEGTNSEAKQELYVKENKESFIETYTLIFLILIIIFGLFIYIKKNAWYWTLKFKIRKIINNRIKR